MKLVTFKKLDGRLAVGECVAMIYTHLGTDMSMTEIAAGEKMPRDESFKVMKHKAFKRRFVPPRFSVLDAIMPNMPLNYPMLYRRSHSFSVNTRPVLSQDARKFSGMMTSHKK